MSKTIVDLSREAVLCQDAINLSGIVHSFSSAMTRLREIEPGRDTSYYNSHPIAVLYSSKITSLTSSEETGIFTQAYRKVIETMGEKF